MKRKALKISSNTLFVYKSVKSSTGKNSAETEPTTSMMTTSTLVGIYQK